VAQKSLQQQAEVEAQNGLDFDTFLQKYFNNEL